jgi:hypothetical protein
MRHLIIAAAMIFGSLLAVQTTIGTLEQWARRGHVVESFTPPSPPSPSAAREVPGALRLPSAAMAAPPQQSLRLPARRSSAQLAENRS